MNVHVGQPSLSRRELLKTAGIAGAATLLGNAPTAFAQDQKPKADRKRVLRLAHLTDMHVQPERRGAAGLTACLRHVQSQPDPPELILTGGDTIMDCMAEDHARTRLQWELWQKILKAECSLPVESCIGNHDVWGWNKQKSKTTGDEPLYGKKWAMEMFGVDSPYRSFERAGWRFIILDSVFPEGEGYQGRLDDAQFAWLESELKTTPAETPVLLLSHIPILSAAVFFDGDLEQSGNWVVPRSHMHIDARRIKDLLYEHRNVKLALSGHLHLVDRVEYLGVKYACSGAVSGAWWRGAHHECEPGYALVNLYADGTSDHEYVTYGWVAVEE
jgi:3',5'-cyclic AMP phosphodiesterase CpdA